jgi:hypothetical protein
MSLRTIALAALLGFAGSLSFAQQAPAPAATAPAAQDCAKTRHDHGADKGTPSASSGCKPTAKKSKTAKAAKKADMQGHDHGKMHKNQ